VTGSTAARCARRNGGLVLILAVSAIACRQGMYNQPKMRPYRRSTFFDGSSARPIPAGTVARGHLDEDAAYFAGTGPDGKLVTELPAQVALTRELLARGKERFEIYCSPCHGRTGSGVGMIVRRGFKRPPAFTVDRLRNERIGYFFDVMTHGFGQMSSYAAQVPAADRWAIAAYVRALQLSQAAPASVLAEADRKALDAALPARGPSDVGIGDVSVTLPSAQAHVGPAEVSLEGQGRRLPHTRRAATPAGEPKVERRQMGAPPSALRPAPEAGPRPVLTPLPPPAAEKRR
jgi:mono/diheme cytochrome c family protein